MAYGGVLPHTPDLTPEQACTSSSSCSSQGLNTPMKKVSIIPPQACPTSFLHVPFLYLQLFIFLLLGVFGFFLDLANAGSRNSRHNKKSNRSRRRKDSNSSCKVKERESTDGVGKLSQDLATLKLGRKKLGGQSISSPNLRWPAPPPSSSTINNIVSSSSPSTSSIRPPSPSVPLFWLGNEEPSHAKEILHAYHGLLGLAVRRPANSRSPPHFVGCVKRQRIPPSVARQLDKAKKVSSTGRDRSNVSQRNHGHEVDTENLVETLDYIAIFQRENVPIGITQTLVSRHVCRTQWDEEQALPSSLTHLDTQSAADFYNALEQDKQTKAAVPYYLYALPVFGVESNFSYVSTREEREVGYASSEAHLVHESLLQLGRSVTPQSSYAYEPTHPVQFPPHANGNSDINGERMNSQFSRSTGYFPFSPIGAEPGDFAAPERAVSSPTCIPPLPRNGKKFQNGKSLLTQALLSRSQSLPTPWSTAPTGTISSEGENGSDADFGEAELSLHIDLPDASPMIVRQDTPATPLSPSPFPSDMQEPHPQAHGVSPISTPNLSPVSATYLPLASPQLFPPPVGSSSSCYSFPRPPCTKKTRSYSCLEESSENSDLSESPSPSMGSSDLLSRSMEEDKSSLLDRLGAGHGREDSLFGLGMDELEKSLQDDSADDSEDEDEDGMDEEDCDKTAQFELIFSVNIEAFHQRVTSHTVQECGTLTAGLRSAVANRVEAIYRVKFVILGRNIAPLNELVLFAEPCLPGFTRQSSPPVDITPRIIRNQRRLHWHLSHKSKTNIEALSDDRLILQNSSFDQTIVISV
eukprot:g59492.t1